MFVKELSARQRIPCTLEKQHRHRDIGKLIHPQLFGLAGGMERVRIKDETGCLVSLGYEIGPDSTTHRAASKEKVTNFGAEIVGGAPMTLDQLLCAIGAFRTSLGIRVVEGHHHQAVLGKSIAKHHDERVVLIGSRTMSEKQPRRSCTGQTPRYLSTRPWDGDCFGHETNVEHRGTVHWMRLVVHDTAEATAAAAAARVAGVIGSAEVEVTVGLAGGSTPAATYAALRTHPLGWSRVDAWLSDERWVQPDELRSNGRMAAEALMDHVDARFHRPAWGELMEPNDSAALYESTIRAILGDSRPHLILLGMGDDGHTASLFPDTPALGETDRWFVAQYVPQQQETRITATFPLLWAAELLLVLVVGESKAEALAESFAGRTPAGRLGEGDGKVEWYADVAAASLVS